MYTTNLFMYNNLNILFTLMVFLSSLLSVSSSNWLGAWMGLELNMLSFVPLMTSKKNLFSAESMLIYFLTQASASALFLMMCLLNSYFSFSFHFIFPLPHNLLLTIPLMIKLASAPFHAWFIYIVEAAPWPISLLLMTWQKIAPLFILTYTHACALVFALLSLMIGSFGGLNHSSLRKIMAFSSVNHLGWLLSTLILNKSVMLIYFSFYVFMNVFVITNLHPNSLYYLSQLLSPSSNSLLVISMLSLGGLPPFLGFLPKWMVMQAMVSLDHTFLIFVMLMTALITLFYYLRITYNTLMLTFSAPKWLLVPSPAPTYSATMALMTALGLAPFNLFFI